MLCRASSASSFSMMPLWMPDDAAVPDRVVVPLDLRMTLREVAHVDERLGRAGRDVELVEEGARAAPKLRDADLAVAAVGVPDRIGAPLGDSGEQSLRGERPVDGRLRTEAESRYAAHGLLFDSADRTTSRT